MRNFLIVCTLSLAAAALTAQTAPASKALYTLVESQNCPVNLTSRRWSVGSVKRALATANPKENEHGLYLYLPPNNAKNVTSAVAVVRGPAPQPYAEPASTAAPNDLTQTFHLAGLLRGSWKLTTDQVPFVREIDITEIHFADGAIWHESADSHCRTEPNGFLLVENPR
jgi:hypothetical protein